MSKEGQDVRFLAEMREKGERLRRALPDDLFLQCSNCGVRARPGVHTSAHCELSGPSGWTVEKYEMVMVKCPSCLATHVFVSYFGAAEKVIGRPPLHEVWRVRAYPQTGRFVQPFPHTPKQYVKHYLAACRTLEASPEASAAMARRCLEEVLKDQGYKQYMISKKIEALLNESDPKKHLPTGLHECVDHIRTFGNFGAHALDDKTTLQVVDVEPGEAEWCIEIIEALFDHYFERPARLNARKAQANAKLTAAGKPHAKP
jgi:hypothetical protein